MTDTAVNDRALNDRALNDRGLTAVSPLVDVSDSEGPKARAESSGRHRYTGPELSALLNQVRRELGAEASIVEANRVRSGGIAGFFAKESFEVVAAPANAEQPSPSPPPVPPVAAKATRNDRPPSSAVPASPVTTAPVPVPSSPPPPPPPKSGAAPAGVRRRTQAPSDISVALLERAEAISALERVSIGPDLEDPDGRRASESGRFREVLEAELVAGSSSLPAPPEPLQQRSDSTIVDVEPPTVIAIPGAPAARPEVEREPIVVPDGPAARSDVGALSADVVWEEQLTVAEPPAPLTDRTRTSKTLAPATRAASGRGSLMMIIGSASAATDVARGLIAGSHTDYAELVVVASEPDAIDLPTDRVGRHYEAVTRHLFDWTVRGASGIVVVDVALGRRLRAEVECLRNIGADSIVVVDDRRAPAIETLRQLDGIAPIEGTIVVSAPGATDPVTDG